MSKFRRPTDLRKPAVWLIAAGDEEHVRMICLTDQPEEIVAFEALVPTSWHVEKFAHSVGISTAMAANFRKMAQDGIFFSGRFARSLGIETPDEPWDGAAWE